MPPRWPQARIASFSQSFWRRLESRHFYSANGFGGYLGFSKLLLGASVGFRGLPEKGKTLRPLSLSLRGRLAEQDPFILQRITSPRGLLHFKYEAIRDVAKNPEKMK